MSEAPVPVVFTAEHARQILSLYASGHIEILTFNSFEGGRWVTSIQNGSPEPYVLALDMQLPLPLQPAKDDREGGDHRTRPSISKEEVFRLLLEEYCRRSPL